MGFANPMVNVYSHDIEAAVRFYDERLGFTESFRTPTEGVPEHVELRLDGITIALSSAEAATRVHGLAVAPGSHGFQLVVWTDDVDAAYDALVAAGVPTHISPHDTGNGNRNAVVRDPDGNLVELVAKRA
jgi:catechol 2,3-dioxygenase-like lactoylglutathione lyase family enzyme